MISAPLATRRRVDVGRLVVLLRNALHPGRQQHHRQPAATAGEDADHSKTPPVLRRPGVVTLTMPTREHDVDRSEVG